MYRLEAFEGLKVRTKRLGKFLSRQCMSSYIRGNCPFLIFYLKTCCEFYFIVEGHVPMILCETCCELSALHFISYVMNDS